MKIMTAIKRVPDYNLRVRPLPDQLQVDLRNVKMSINPFCEIAVEEAVRIKERGIASEVIAVSIGEDACKEQIRVALAIGADRGIFVKTNAEIQPLASAKILYALYRQEQPDLVILGKQSIDGDNNQTGQMLAGLAGLPQGTFASAVTFAEGAVTVTREVDVGLETIKLTLPAVITADLRLNTPRYLTLPNIMRARKKEMTTIALDSLNVDVTPKIELLGVASPTQRQPCTFVNDAVELVDKLTNEARVL